MISKITMLLSTGSDASRRRSSVVGQLRIKWPANKPLVQRIGWRQLAGRVVLYDYGPPPQAW